jgi:hypothetical protein
MTGLADSFLAGCVVVPLPMLWNFGPIAAITAMMPLLLLGCRHGALEPDARTCPARPVAASARNVRRGSRGAGPFAGALARISSTGGRARAHRSPDAKETGMDRHARLADFFLAGCAILPLPLLLTFGPLAAFGTMAVLLVVGCYHGAMEQAETGEGPLYGHGLDGNGAPRDGREAGRPR